jgi:hypothetical protein
MNSGEKTKEKKTQCLNQCCVTVMIYCGSGSYFRKVLVAVPALVPIPIPDPDPDIFSPVFQ